VAVKFSYDGGLSWAPPQPVVIDGLPANYQRPFDPTLTRLSDGRLRMYFSSSPGMPPPGNIWFNTSPNGGVWTGYTPTNLKGGDPSAVRLPDCYLIVYVGQPYTTPVRELLPAETAFEVFPNPAGSTLYVRSRDSGTPEGSYHLYATTGCLLQSGVLAPETVIKLGAMPGRMLLLQIVCGGRVYWGRVRTVGNGRP